MLVEARKENEPACDNNYNGPSSHHQVPLLGAGKLHKDSPLFKQTPTGAGLQQAADYFLGIITLRDLFDLDELQARLEEKEH